VRPVKGIQLRYAASADLKSLFEDFRLTCNDAIRIAISEKPKSRFRLIKLAYPRLKEYTASTLGNTSVHDTSRVAEIKERYRAIRAGIGEKTRQDRRISQPL
jgi:hypothetical protein